MNKPLIKSLPIAAAIAAVVASAGAVRNRHRRLGRFRSLIEPPIQCATPVRRHAGTHSQSGLCARGFFGRTGSEKSFGCY